MLISRRHRTPETLVFSVAIAVAVVHAVDDAFIGRQAGVDLAQHAPAGLISLIAGVVAVLAFPRLRPGMRAAGSARRSRGCAATSSRPPPGGAGPTARSPSR